MLMNEDYLDGDGLLRCGICGKRKQARLNIMGQEHVVGCMCDCGVKEREEIEQRFLREENERKLKSRRRIGLQEERFLEWRFENDNGSNSKLDIARKYVLEWDKMKKDNIGLLLMGPPGTGKSFMAGCIANELIDEGVSVMMTNFSKILNELTNYHADKNAIIRNLVSFPLLIIDDLGIERCSEFSLEQIYNVIDSRYCSKKPLIVTTNLSMPQMKDKYLDMAKQRIYSRIFEMCVTVYLGGTDLRRDEGNEKLRLLKELN